MLYTIYIQSLSIYRFYIYNLSLYIYIDIDRYIHNIYIDAIYTIYIYKLY